MKKYMIFILIITVFIMVMATVKYPKDTLTCDVYEYTVPPKKELANFCNKREYTYATLDEQRLRILKLYTNLALEQLNKKSELYHYVFLEIINATSSINEYGNSKWRVNLMVEESNSHITLRFILEFVIEIVPCHNKALLTCAEYTTFPFPRYFAGYPAIEQIIPLPSQIISTGGNEVLSQKGIDPDYPKFKDLHLYKAYVINSDLALGTELSSNFVNIADPAVNDTTLGSSKYPKKRFARNDVQLQEKFYADCLEKKGDVIDTDIFYNYSLKPSNFECTGKPENRYHYTDSSETYNQSMVKPKWPNGWIQPAVWRNKWNRLWSEPRDRFEYPSTPIKPMWNNIGVLYPTEQDDTHPGNRWSTQQTPRVPLYWPTVTGLPTNDGPNNWLFDKGQGFNANLPHAN